ncbi:MAG: prephenate dehydrogenase/arogenate dehydrogenase family protein [Verrucomicrobiota bacterium]
MFDQISILGPGLLGASIGMAAHARGLARVINSWSRRAETRANCLSQPWCNAVFDSPEEAVADSGLIIICTPVETIIPLLKRIAPALKADAVVTDVGSTKSRICREAQGVNLGSATFLGSHPMAGSEQNGMTHAKGDLFENAACILTPLEGTPHIPAETISQFWKELGMLVSRTSPEKHDEIVAHISHLPHVLAAALCSYLSGQRDEWRSLAGGGLRDTTRIASGDPGLWRQILVSNREEVVRAINGLENELHSFKSSLLNDDANALQQKLERGKSYRDQLKR